MGEVTQLPGTEGREQARGSRGPALNEVRLIGRLGDDPQLRYTPSGTAVIEARIATHEREDVQWHDLVAYGGLAEVTAQYQRKGSLIFVSGRLQTSTWKAQDGSPRRRVQVVAEAIQFLERATAKDQ